MKFALLQINPTVGDFAGNARLIADAVRQAGAQGAQLAITPELALVGYLPRGGQTQRTSVYGESKHPDTSSSYYIRQEWPQDHPDVLAKKPWIFENKWIEGLPGFRETMLDYYGAMSKLVSRIVELQSVALGRRGYAVLGGKYGAPRLIRLGVLRLPAALAAMSIPLGSQGHLLGYWGSLAALTALGIFTGMFAVPLQVFMQSRPPDVQKGRMIATQNLLNWIGIFLSTGIYFVANRIFESLGWPPNAMFGVTAITMLPIAIAFRPIMPSGTREATETTPPDISSPS